MGLHASVPARTLSCLRTCCRCLKFSFFKVERCGKIVTLDTAGTPCVLCADVGWLLQAVGHCSCAGWIRLTSVVGKQCSGTPQPVSLCCECLVCSGCVFSYIQNEQISLQRGKHIFQSESAQENEKWWPEDVRNQPGRISENVPSSPESSSTAKRLLLTSKKADVGGGLEQCSSQWTKGLQPQPAIGNRWFDPGTGGQNQKAGDVEPHLSCLAQQPGVVVWGSVK